MRLIEKSITSSVYDVLNESFDPDKTAKRIARYKEFDNGHVLHSWLEDKTAEEAEELARQESIKNPDDVYYVQYDDVMNSSNDIRWLNGEKYVGGGFHYVDGKPVHHTSEEYDLVRRGEKTWEDITREKMNESVEEQLNDLYNADKVEWDDLSGSDQTAVEYFSSNFGDNIAGKSWDEVESDIIEACYDIGYANEELINSGYWMDGDMDPEPDEKKVTDYIFQNYFLPKKNSKNMNESAETGKITLKDYAMNYFDGDIDEDVTDTEVDMLVAFVYDFNEEPKDNYDRFLNLLGERTKVVKVGNNVLTCDFSSVFKPYEDKLQDFFNMEYSEFDEAWAEAVSNLEALISGNAGEKTYGELVDILTSKQINESASYEGYTDKEILKDVIDNFKKITGKDVKDVLNYDEAVEGFFKQGEIESTGESIINYLTKKGLSRSHIDELLYKLDDELTSLWNKL